MASSYNNSIKGIYIIMLMNFILSLFALLIVCVFWKKHIIDFFSKNCWPVNQIKNGHLSGSDVKYTIVWTIVNLFHYIYFYKTKELSLRQEEVHEVLNLSGLLIILKWTFLLKYSWLLNNPGAISIIYLLQQVLYGLHCNC